MHQTRRGHGGGGGGEINHDDNTRGLGLSMFWKPNGIMYEFYIRIRKVRLNSDFDWMIARVETNPTMVKQQKPFSDKLKAN